MLFRLGLDSPAIILSSSMNKPRLIGPEASFACLGMCFEIMLFFFVA